MLDDTKNESAYTKLKTLVNVNDIAMLTTETEGKLLRSRPMETCWVSDNGELFFFVTTNSELVHELTEKNYVNLSYSKSASHSFTSISGVAQMINEPNVIKQYWQNHFEHWIPGGIDNPALLLLKITLINGEHWGFTSKMDRVIKTFNFSDNKPEEIPETVVP